MSGFDLILLFLLIGAVYLIQNVLDQHSRAIEALREELERRAPEAKPEGYSEWCDD